MIRSTTLIGLEAILADPSCERVELLGAGGERVVRIREGGDVWADEAGRLPRAMRHALATTVALPYIYLRHRQVRLAVCRAALHAVPLPPA